ncbi:TonB-dependent receptor domain-containing protein [Luteimonas sp. R10]|uniref:TonB-dependent receptor domain-containing protein n=1 Tax=Luteimonas sp. R10 TaxID=3108176 RepID=UPI0030932C43|nr:TonB-dependent receptor [Luteimonas sp. R10]
MTPVRDQKRLTARAARPCTLLLAMLPCLVAYAHDDVTARFDIPEQRLDAALSEYARQSGQQLLYAPELATGKTGHAVHGEKPALQALGELLADTDLRYTTSASGVILIDSASAVAEDAKEAMAEEAPQGNAGETADTQPAAASQVERLAEPGVREQARSRDVTTFDAIVVTAQKKVENIQRVPIAITAFGGGELDDRKIETGGELVTATPNVSFTKTNFASYNFQIRGIGTQALSVTTDPAVAISFNSTPMIRNRLFEQEYFDVERVEVLRGPQGTLYGRNATAGVVNMIPNLADPGAFEASAKGEIGNYGTRRVNGMVNLPLSDSLAFRLATQYTKRDGYDHNEVTGKDVNDRDILGVRASLGFRPSDRFDASLAWEHYQEDDTRARTGKQLCHNDPGPATIGATTVSAVDRNYMSQGCVDGSLYDQGAYGVPNGAGLPYVLAAAGLAGITGYELDDDGNFVGLGTLIQPGLDPYADATQSRDLRRIATTYDPKFNASNDVVQFNFDVGIGDRLNFISQSLYTRDRYYSTQDYGRFQSGPVFADTSNNLYQFLPDGTLAPAYDLAPGGVFCDPQLGCSDRMLMVDLVDAQSTQRSQEFRLQSSYDGPFNFSIGANYLEFEIDESYYAFNNVFTAISQSYFNRVGFAGSDIVASCPPGQTEPRPDGSGRSCLYIDPNPIASIDGQGHNYFRSRNLAETRSAAIFGEGYWQVSDTLRLTAGLRFTRDVKTTTPIPSQLLLAPGYVGGGYVNSGYPALPEIRQTWNEPTGRLVLDWSPDLSFTDSTMFYASLARGYKAGGTNSPGIGADPDVLPFVARDPRFRAEYVNALELGMKNVMADGRFLFNATLFYNDYKDYQVSQIVDRATLNENFDARTWGAELEAVWRPTDGFQLSGNLGLLETRIANGQSSIDVMDRTAGNPDWVVVRPWIQLASNCIAPKELVETVLQYHYSGQAFGTPNAANTLQFFCTSNLPSGAGFLPGSVNEGVYGFSYDPLVDGPNGGQGFAKDLGGNHLPNAPHLTLSLSPQYTFFTPHGDLTLRADLYYQGKSWARVYQDEIDRLDDWNNVNLSLTWYRPETDLAVQLYVKNLLDGDAITGTFLNSDDTGLTSNVFIQDPKIIGLSIRKGFY